MAAEKKSLGTIFGTGVIIINMFYVRSMFYDRSKAITIIGF